MVEAWVVGVQKIVLNKKGQELAIFGMVAFLLIILTLLFYWFFFVTPLAVKSKLPSYGPIQQSITAQDRLDLDLILLNYLRTPIVVENTYITISDLARLYSINKLKYETPMKEETKKIMDAVFKSYNYKLKIGDTLLAEKGQFDEPSLSAKQFIPFQEGATISVSLETGEQDKSYTTEYTVAG